MDRTVKDDTKKKSNSVPRMVPLLSKRSIIVLIIGLVVGAGLGIGYWAISPKINEVTAEISAAGVSQDGPHESTVYIQVINPGSEYVSPKELQYQGEYYAAKANTLPFLEYLSQKLSEVAPEYSHTVEEIEEMTLIQYDWNNSNPGMIEVTVTGSSEHEAFYLAGLIPHEFLNFLIAEENRIEQEEYEDTLADIEAVKIALFDAEKELADVILAGNIYDINSDPDYIALQATVTALETELFNQTAELASYIALGDVSQDYLNSVATVERTSNALAEARNNLTNLETENSVYYSTENREYNVAQARVDSLSIQLSNLTSRLGQFFTPTTEENGTVDYLVVGTASDPIPIAPDRIRGRNAAMIGGICGMGLAWVAINRRWIIRQLSSTGVDENDIVTRDEV